jgi:hypothetical protein
VTLLPRYTHRNTNKNFWPTDEKWASDYGEDWMKGRYVSVEECLPQERHGEYYAISESGAINEHLCHKMYGNDERCLTVEGQMWEKYSDTTPQAGGRWKIRNPRTGMCLAMFPTECINEYKHDRRDCWADSGSPAERATTGFVSNHATMRTPDDGKHLMVGLDVCDSWRVFSWTDHEEGKIGKGETAEVDPGMTLQQRYQYRLLPTAAQVAYENGAITAFNKEPGKEDKTATLLPSDFDFWFEPNDSVYSSVNSNECTVGKVTSCSKSDFKCQVNFDGQTQTVDLSTLSPADAIWPRKWPEAPNPPQ